MENSMNFIQMNDVSDERIQWCQDNLVGDISYEIDNNNRLIAHGNIIFVDALQEMKYKIDELYGNFETENAINRRYGQLKSLKNMPTIIHGKFNVSMNKGLTSLEGGPETVYGTYWCSNCSLKTADHIAKNITGSLLMFNNNIENIDAIADINVDHSIDLTSNPIRRKSNPNIVNSLIEQHIIDIDK